MSSRRRRPYPIAELDLGADQELALIHIPSRLRLAFRALFAVDAAMRDTLARSRDPNVSRIKLAWWREHLQALDRAPPPAEPRLQAVASELLTRGVRGAELAHLEVGWATLLDDQPNPGMIGVRGAKLFEMAGILLGATDSLLSNAGFVYALMSAARVGYDPDRNLVVPLLVPLRDHRLPRKLRAITGLARLAARDFRHGPPYEPEGSSVRALVLLAHRWTGRT